jgi:hypothetical protein
VGLVYRFGSPEAALKSLVLYLPLWGIAEFFHGVRMREATKCTVCGFDPVLYRHDWWAARKIVEDRLNVTVGEMKVELQKKTDAAKAGGSPAQRESSAQPPSPATEKGQS